MKRKGTEAVQGLNMVFENLKALDMSGSLDLTSTPDFTKLPLGEHFFKVYSGCRIYVSEVPYWISDQSGYKKGSKVFVDLVPDMSHNFLGLVLCFKGTTTTPNFIKYTVKNTTSGYKCEKQVYSKSLELFMVMLPRSIFWVSNGDDKLEVESDTNICGMHLLYKRESKTRKKLPPPDNKNEVEAEKLAREDETQYATMLNALKTHSVGLQTAVETGDYLLAQGHQRFISTLAIALSKQMMAQILSSRGSTTITLAFSGESSKNDKGKPVAVETKKRGKDDNYRKGMR
ncbi:hypothetical protein POM88_020285 [Heracleum sosnowskyi]|uniref:Uncharacterized protein n=1 Tax=Heracleum sosnowskyi TaxID=360622 RepID=A0AAD8IBM0_9APIA|nr:hypothetical protein POM88_020285 [Heracleum sosnowskyi]